MPETITNKSPDRENKVENIYSISENTDKIIACIQGLHTSPTMVQELFSKGNKNFACLSGGIIQLSDSLNDTRTSSLINDSFYDFETDYKTKYKNLKQTECYSFNEYYGKMANKEILIITHSVFHDLKGSIVEEFFNENNIKFQYFESSKRLSKYLNQPNPTDLVK